MQKEFLYILENQHAPGITKVGRTTQSITERVAQLNAETGSTGGIAPFAWFEVESSARAEFIAHTVLSKSRLSNRHTGRANEWFNVTPAEALNAIYNEIDFIQVFSGSKDAALALEDAQGIRDEMDRKREAYEARVAAYRRVIKGLKRDKAENTKEIRALDSEISKKQGVFSSSKTKVGTLQEFAIFSLLIACVVVGAEWYLNGHTLGALALLLVSPVVPTAYFVSKYKTFIRNKHLIDKEVAKLENERRQCKNKDQKLSTQIDALEKAIWADEMVERFS